MVPLPRLEGSSKELGEGDKAILCSVTCTPVVMSANHWSSPAKECTSLGPFHERSPDLACLETMRCSTKLVDT